MVLGSSRRAGMEPPSSGMRPRASSLPPLSIPRNASTMGRLVRGVSGRRTSCLCDRACFVQLAATGKAGEHFAGRWPVGSWSRSWRYR
jgi:hypothetical protein